MTHFSLRLLDLSETVTEIFERKYSNALDALDAAKVLSSGGTVEVWSSYGRIARVKKNNESSDPEDRVSG
jgi:hypothetical protein